MNPFAKRRFVTANGEPMAALRFKGHQSRAINDAGEFNASDKKDLVHQIDRLITAYMQGDIRSEVTPSSRDTADARKQALAEAVADKTGNSFQVLGEVLADEIAETTNREGFARKFCQFKELAQGETGRIRIRNKSVMAWVATGPSAVTPSIVRGIYIYPPEFHVSAQILIDERDIGQSSGDMLEDAYVDGLENIMKVEDQTWKMAADNAATNSNTMQYFTSLTPTIFSGIRSQVARWGIPVTGVLMAQDIWDDIIGNSDFMSFFDPVTKHDLVLDGFLGVLMGADLITDAFRVPELKVLEAGEIYAIGSPQTHGTIMQRGGLGSNPIDQYNMGQPFRGWFLSEMISLTIGNSKSVAKGQRS